MKQVFGENICNFGGKINGKMEGGTEGEDTQRLLSRCFIVAKLVTVLNSLQMTE